MSLILPPAFDLVFSDALTSALRTVPKMTVVESVTYFADVDGLVAKVDCDGNGYLPGSTVADMVFVDGKGYVWTDLGSKATVRAYDHALATEWASADAAMRIGALISQALAG